MKVSSGFLFLILPAPVLFLIEFLHDCAFWFLAPILALEFLRFKRFALEGTSMVVEVVAQRDPKVYTVYPARININIYFNETYLVGSLLERKEISL